MYAGEGSRPLQAIHHVTMSSYGAHVLLPACVVIKEPPQLLLHVLWHRDSVKLLVVIAEVLGVYLVPLSLPERNPKEPAHGLDSRWLVSYPIVPAQNEEVLAWEDGEPALKEVLVQGAEDHSVAGLVVPKGVRPHAWSAGAIQHMATIQEAHAAQAGPQLRKSCPYAVPVGIWECGVRELLSRVRKVRGALLLIRALLVLEVRPSPV